MKYTKTELLDAYCGELGYQSDIPVLVDGVPTEETESNPETKVQFLKRTERESSFNTAMLFLDRKAMSDAKMLSTSNGEGITLE